MLKVLSNNNTINVYNKSIKVLVINQNDLKIIHC